MRRTQVVLGLAIPALIAIGVLLPHVLQIGFLSDDFVLTNLLRADGASANWHEIGAQFGERWLYSQAYWRPIVNVVYGLNAELLGTTAFAFGVVNLLMHVGVVLATAWLCLRARRLRSPLLGAILGASLIGVHPATIETVCWISARVTGVEVLFRMLALCAMQAHLRTPSRARYAAVVVWSALALGSKESAVVLPIALFALDLIEAPERALRARARTHAPLLLLWGGYFVLRIVLLGGVVGSPLPEPTFAQFAEILARKLEVLLTPGGIGMAIAWTVFALASVVFARDRGRAAVWTGLTLVGWIGLCLAPTYKAPLGQGFIGSRMLYDALPIVGLAVAHGLGAARNRIERAVAIAIGTVIPALAFAPADGYAHAFATAWQQNRAAIAALETFGADATDERPLGILSAPPCRQVPGPINPVSYFVLGRRPYAARPFAAVGLGALLDRFPYSTVVFQDPRPAAALFAAGATLVRWDEAQGRMLAWPATPPDVLPIVGEGTAVAFAQALTPFAPGAIEIVADAVVRGGAVIFRTSLGEFGGPAAIVFGAGEAVGDARVFHVDPTRHAPLLALAMAGGTLLGLRVEPNGGRVRSIRVAARPAELPRSSREDGSPIAFAALSGALIAPPSDLDLPMRCVIASGATTYAFDVTPGATVRIPDDVAFHLRMFGNALRSTRCHYWFERIAPQGAAGTARSPVGWFELGDLPR